MTSIEKQYLRAASSSNLKADVHHDDWFTLVSAGGAGETMAAALLRVRGEYDTIRSEAELDMRVWLAHENRAKELELIAIGEVRKMNRGPTRAELYRAAAKAIRKQAHDEQLSAHALILVRMKSMPMAKALVWRFTRDQIEKRGVQMVDDDVIRLSAKVLQAFVAPRCPACGGKGFTGGHRQPAVRCAPCRETGSLTLDWGGIEFEQLGRDFLSIIDSRVQNLLRQMARRTRG